VWKNFDTPAIVASSASVYLTPTKMVPNVVSSPIKAYSLAGKKSISLEKVLVN
jgi:hypothetical protein